MTRELSDSTEICSARTPRKLHALEKKAAGQMQFAWSIFSFGERGFTETLNSLLSCFALLER